MKFIWNLHVVHQWKLQWYVLQEQKQTCICQFFKQLSNLYRDTEKYTCLLMTDFATYIIIHWLKGHWVKTRNRFLISRKHWCYPHGIQKEDNQKTLTGLRKISGTLLYYAWYASNTHWSADGVNKGLSNSLRLQYWRREEGYVEKWEMMGLAPQGKVTSLPSHWHLHWSCILF